MGVRRVYRTGAAAPPKFASRGNAQEELLDKTSAARAELQALKEDLLGALAIDGIAYLANLKIIDLARYFARFAELGAPVPRHLLATLCAEVARLTGAAVSSEVASSWGAVPLLLAAGAGADASAGPAGAALSVVPGFAPPARVAAARAAALAPVLAAAPAPLLAAAPAAAAACVIDKSAARQALEMLAKAVAGRADLQAKVLEMEALLDAPAPATSAAPAAHPTTVSLADTAAANASSGPMDVDAAPLADAAAPDAAAGASDLMLDALREWLASVSADIRADAKHAACNTHMLHFQRSQRQRGYPVGYTAEAVFGTTDVDAINRLSEEEFLRLKRIAVNALPEVVAARAKRESELVERSAERKAAAVAERRQLRSFLDATFVAEAAARDYIITLADARGSAARIFPPAGAPREHRPSSRAPQIEDAAKLAAMPDDVFEAAFKAACNTKVIRFEKSLCALKGHYPEADLSVLTLERVFGTTDVDVINALSEEAYQDALAKGKTAAGLKPVDNTAATAKGNTKKTEKYHATKAKNSGEMPKFKGDESCTFAAKQKEFPVHFRAHLEECPSCRVWAWQVSQLTAAPVGAFPSTLSVVKHAAKVQEKGFEFPGRFDVADFTVRRDAAARAAKRKGAKGAAPPRKKPKK